MAEDETEISALVSSRLRSAGHSVVVAGDGQEALDRMTENRLGYDLLITDSNMPRLSGFELVERARKEGFSGKIIMASAFTTLAPDVVERSHLVDRIVQKPYFMADLQQAVEEVCFAPAPVPAPAVEAAPATISKFYKLTKFALSQFVFWAIADMVTTWIGLRSGLLEGNPFSAWTMKLLSPEAGLILKELFITAPLCVGGGYVCFRMAKEMSGRRKMVLANLPVWVGAGLHIVATLNNVWQLNS